MIRRLTLLAGVLFPALAQEIALRPHFQTGDAFELLAIHGRSDSLRTEVNGSSRAPITVTVIEAGPNGFVIDWIQGDTDLSADPAAQSDPIASAAMRAARDVHLEAELSPQGEYKRLRNPEQVLAALQKTIDGLMQLVAEQVPAEQVAQVQAAVRQLISPQTLLSTAAQDIQMYFKIYGAELKPGEQVETESRQPGIDGSMIPAYFSVKMNGADGESATLSTVTRYDRARLSRATGGASIDMRDSADYVYDRASGLMRSVKGERSIVSGGSRRVDTFEMQLVRPPAH